MHADPADEPANQEIPLQDIAALLFDLGGVIIDVDFMRTLQYWAEHAGQDPQQLAASLQPDAGFEQHERGELSCEDYFRRLRDQHALELSDQQMRAGWNATLGEEIPGVRALVERLAPRIPIYVFSNTNPTHQQQWEQDCAETLSHFRSVFVSSDLGQRKPERRAYLSVADKMGLAPDQILFFDDNPDNVRGAREAGLHAVQIREHTDLVRAVAHWIS